MHGSLVQRLFSPVSAAPLARFRVLFGALMAWETWRYWSNGWIASHYLQPSFHFTYYGFGWVKPLPGSWMYGLFAALGILALAIACGWRYRLVMPLFAAGFAYVFLIDQAFYLNHWYLIVLLSILLSAIPTPSFRGMTAAWTVWLLRGQLLLVYLYAGVAKLDGDWLQAVPLKAYLASKSDLPVIGPLLDEPWTSAFFSYGGLAFDLLIGPALVWHRSRPYALAAAAGFHLLNASLFPIGVFPWLMLAATFALFWPRREEEKGGDAKMKHRRLVVGFLAGWAAVQVFLPLRHFLYPGNSNWTEEGHRFSWHMMLRSKKGAARFFAVDPRTDLAREIDVARFLTGKQIKEMSYRPDMILQFAHHAADVIERDSGVRPQVRVAARASLNGRPAQALIDPEIDLASRSRSLAPADWIVPLKSSFVRTPYNR
jgi:hypothetical protein